MDRRTLAIKFRHPICRALPYGQTVIPHELKVTQDDVEIAISKIMKENLQRRARRLINANPTAAHRNVHRRIDPVSEIIPIRGIRRGDNG